MNFATIPAVRRSPVGRPWMMLSLLMFTGLGLSAAQGQTWVEQGPGPIRYGQVEGMSAQSNPVYGAIERIAVNPSDPNIMLIGSVNGGVWRTTNATAANPTWSPVTDFLPSLSMGALTYDAANASTLYAGVGRFSALSRTGGARSGLYTSTDGGVNWAAVAGNTTFASQGVNISATIANGQNILVTVDNADNYNWSNLGLWRSTNGGTSFTHVAGGGTGLPDIFGAAVTADPTNSSRYYLAGYNPWTTANNGVWRSDNAGATWTKINDAAIDAVANTTTVNMKVSVNKNGTLFVGIEDSGRLAGVFRSTDQGASFTSFGTPTTLDGPTGNQVTNGVNPGGQGGIHFSMAVDPTNDNVVYIGGDRQPLGTEVNGVSAVGATNYTGRLFRSSGAGTWTAITNNQTAGGSSPHADSRALAIDLNGNLVESDDGGLFRRTSPTTSTGNWTAIGSTGSTGLRVTEIHSIAYDNHGGVLIAGAQDTGASQQSAHGSMTWNELNQGDGGVVGVYDRPGGNSYRYNSSQNLGGFSYRTYDANGVQVGGTVYPAMSVNGGGGKTITQFEPSAFPDDDDSKASAYGPDALPGVPFYTKYAVNSVDAGRLVFGTKSLYETADHGATLDVLGGITSGAPTVRFASTVNALAYGGFKNGTGYADVLYSGEGTELRIRPAGSGFGVLPGVDAAYTTAAGGSGFSITDLVLDYTDWDHAFVANSANRVFYSFDAGTSWTEIPGLSGMIGGGLDTLEYVERGTWEAIFAGGLNGVFWSQYDGSAFGPWAEFGAGSLPNANVLDLNYDPYADVLAVGTLGRGAWTMDNVSLLGAGAVPEPSSFCLWAVGCVGFGLWRLRCWRRTGKK